MRKLRLLAGLFLLGLCAGQQAWGQTALPLTVTQDVFNDDNVFTSKVRVEWSGSEDGIKTENLQDGGYLTFKFDEVPGKLSLEYKRSSYGQNRTMWVCESADGETWTDLYRGDPTTSYQVLSVGLSKDTRFIQLGYDAKYKFGDIGSRLGYWRNIVVSAPIFLPETSGTASGCMGTKIAHTFTVNYSNPSGDLVLSSTDPHVVFDAEGATTKTIEGVAGQEGSTEVTVYYDSKYDNSIGQHAVPVTVTDSGYTDCNKTYTLDVTVEEPFALETTSLDAETGVVGTPLPFSFTVSRKAGVVLSFATENGNVAFEQDELLPAEADGDVVVNATYTAVLPGADEADIVIRDAEGVETYTKTLHVAFLSRPAVPVSTVEEVKKYGFKAVWEAAEGVDSYLFSLVDEAGEVCGGYEDYEVEDTFIEVSGLQTGVTYYYTLKAKSGEDLVSDASEPVAVTPVARYLLSATQPDEFVTVLGTEVEQVVSVTTNDLDGEIVLTVEPADAGFVVEPAVLPVEGGEVTVRYQAATVGAHTAVLKLTTANVEPVELTLAGTTDLPAPVALPADDVKKTSFVARWEAVDAALAYRLTVSEDDVALEGYPVETAETSYLVEGLEPGVTYTYYIEAVAGEWVSAASEPVAATPMARYLLSATQPDEFVTVLGTEVEQVVTVTTNDLDGEIVLTVEPTDAGFVVEPAVLPVEGGEVTVRYQSATVGVHTAVLKLTTANVEPVELTLAGTTNPPAPVVLQADNVTATSFMAHWEAVDVQDEALAYRLTVLKDGEALQGYPVETAETSWLVDGLETATTYAYFVEAVVGDLVSAASAEETVFVSNAVGMNKVTAEARVYPSPARETLFIGGCVATEMAVYAVDGTCVARQTVSDNRADVSGLAAGTYMVALRTADGQVYKARFIKQ